MDNQEMFQITNMRNVNWKSPVAKASFTLTVLPQGIQCRDCLLKSGSNGNWIEGKSVKCTPWTDRNGNTHEYSDVVSLRTMDKELLKQLTEFVSNLYNEDGNYEHLNATKAQAQDTASATTTTAAVANGATAAAK